MFFKEKKDDKPEIDPIFSFLKPLRSEIGRNNVESLGLSRNNDGIGEAHWKKIEVYLRENWNNLNFQLTIFSNEIIIPRETDKENIIEECHDSVIAEHRGTFKTYKRVRENYYWPGMHEQINEHVKTCEACQRQKLVRVKTKLPMTITTTPVSGFETVEIDIVGPLPVTELRNKYILTMQCLLTKYSNDISLERITSDVVAETLISQFITIFV